MLNTPTGKIIKVGLVFSFMMMGYLVMKSRSQMRNAKPSGEVTLLGAKGETFKLLPEHCDVQDTQTVKTVMFRSQNQMDLMVLYSVAVDSSLTTLTVTRPNQAHTLVFKKAECEKFDEKLDSSNQTGAIDMVCKQDGFTIQGTLHFAGCQPRH